MHYLSKERRRMILEVYPGSTAVVHTHVARNNSNNDFTEPNDYTDRKGRNLYLANVNKEVKFSELDKSKAKHAYGYTASKILFQLP